MGRRDPIQTRKAVVRYLEIVVPTVDRLKDVVVFHLGDVGQMSCTTTMIEPNSLNHMEDTRKL